jgi:uncharacterized protein
MSEPWSRPLDVDQLADGEADIEFAGALSELPAMPAGVVGSVAGRARFTRSQGLVVAQLTVHGAATLECQRCMQPVTVPLESEVMVALLAAESDVARVPAEFEPVLAPGGRTSIGELIKEELLLSLPIVPLHGGSEPCAVAATAEQEARAERAPETHKPFARLAELMKR